MDNFIEVVAINEENCINCHQCIAVCPVKFCNNGSGDVVKFNNLLCIGCGRCIEACIKCHGGFVESRPGCFDPQILEVFIRIADEFDEIYVSQSD